MTRETLPADMVAAADDMAAWAVEHAAEAGQRPTLATVADPADRMDPLQRRRHLEQRAWLASRSPAQVRAQVAHARGEA